MNLRRITCSDFRGVFKRGLSADERLNLRSLHSTETTQCSVTTLEGDNYILFYTSSRESLATDPEQTGGHNVIYLSLPSTAWSEADIVESGSAAGLFRNLENTWAAILIDDADGRLFMARDRSGAMPIYYFNIDGGLGFATNLNQLPKSDLRIDPHSVSLYLRFLYVPSPRTIYCDVAVVLPGELLVCNGKATRSEDFNPEPEMIPEVEPEDWVAAYSTKLVDAVCRYISRTGSTALFLSGGKDSSSLAIACQLAGLKNVEALTIGFSSRVHDEKEDAKTVAAHLGLRLNTLQFEAQQYQRLWPEMVGHLGQPMGDFAFLPVFAAIKGLHNDFDTYLDGTGSDQSLGILATTEEARAWKAGHSLPFFRHLPWQSVPAGLSYQADCLRKTFLHGPEQQFVSWNGFDAQEIARLTGQQVDFQDTALYRIYGECNSASELKTATVTRVWQPETATRKVVQAAKTYGSTVRFPFMSGRLQHFTCQIPQRWKSQGKTNKVIIREFMARHLPERILRKPKGAFNFPKEIILEGNNFACARQFLSHDVIRRHALVDERVASSYLDEYKKGNLALTDRLWALLLLHTWLEATSG